MACCHHLGPSRRQVLALAGAGAATVALAACGGEEPPPLPRPGERLLPLDEVPVGGSVVTRTAEGADVVVTRVSQDEVVALSAVCTHQGCTVRRQSETLHCPCHGSEFDPVDGTVITGPAEDPLPEIQVRVESGDVVVG